MKRHFQRTTSPVLPVATPQETPVLDEAYLAERFGGDSEFLRGLLTRFAAELPDRVQALRSATDGGDLAEVERLAHSLKGVAATIGVPAVKLLASELTEAARKGDRETLLRLLPQLSADAERTVRTLGGATGG